MTRVLVMPARFFRTVEPPRFVLKVEEGIGYVLWNGKWTQSPVVVRVTSGQATGDDPKVTEITAEEAARLTARFDLFSSESYLRAVAEGTIVETADEDVDDALIASAPDKDRKR